MVYVSLLHEGDPKYIQLTPPQNCFAFVIFPHHRRCHAVAFRSDLRGLGEHTRLGFFWRVSFQSKKGFLSYGLWSSHLFSLIYGP
jgi:hypothetical protein